MTTVSARVPVPDVVRTLQAMELALVDTLSSLGCWLAPIPSAVLVARASVQHLHWPVAVGVVAGAIVEVLGLTTTSTALTLWAWNMARRRSDRPAPFTLAAALVGVYVASTIMLTVMLDIVPGLSRAAPALFPVLALAGTVNLAIRAQHRHRLAEIAAEREERRASRRGGTGAEPGRNRSGTEAEQRRNRSGTEAEQRRNRSGTEAEQRRTTRALAAQLLAAEPGISGAELGRRLGRSARLGRRLKAELEGQHVGTTETDMVASVRG